MEHAFVYRQSLSVLGMEIPEFLKAYVTNGLICTAKLRGKGN
jgi:hypothetical protein